MYKKKIGILTLPLTNNYGGLLQSYALQLYLKKKGFDAKIIDRRHNKSILDNFKFLLKKYLFKGKHQKDVDNLKITLNTRYFKEKYLYPKTEEIHSQKKIKQIVNREKFDAIIVGSDQVWRLDYSRDLFKNMFLDFINDNNVKKLSYAASFGVADWCHDKLTTNIVSDLIQKFDYVSVREDSGLGICKTIFGVDALQHVDPTMLLEKKDYTLLVSSEISLKPNKGNILVYMLDNSEQRLSLVNQIRHEVGGELFNVNVGSKSLKASLEQRTYPSVLNWVKGFMDAEYVIVDSFHGCVFAILYNKPFIAFGNKQRGLTRFSSLLKLFKLENRLILNAKELSPEIIKAPINWELTNSILDHCRKKSDNYFDNLFK